MTSSAERRPVLLVGADGRMGRFVQRLLSESDEFELVERLDRTDTSTVDRIARCGAELGLDFTRAGLGYEHGRAMLAAGMRPVIGTSGVDPADVVRLDELARARSLGGLVVPNFSLGMAVLQRMATVAARVFPACEILELHHERKADAPSGTAADTAHRIMAVHAETGAHTRPVPIHSVRLPGLYAHQEVLFGGDGEVLRVRHDMLGPDAFGPGIRCALRYATRALGVTSGLDAALGADLGDAGRAD